MSKFIIGFMVVFLVGCSGLDEKVNITLTPYEIHCASIEELFLSHGIDQNEHVKCLVTEMQEIRIFDVGSRIALANEITKIRHGI